MALMEVNWRPDNKYLRGFGQTALALLLGIALLLHWLKGLEAIWALHIAAAGLVIYLLSLIWSPLVKPIYLLLIALALPIGWVVSHAAMAILYFLILTPTGLIFRLLGRDLLSRQFDPNAASYWGTHRHPDSPQRYFNQF